MRKPSSDSQSWLVSALETAVYNYFPDHNYTINGTLSSNAVIINGSKNVSDTELSPVNCIPPSIEEFPEDFLRDGDRLRGGFLVHAAIVLYVCSLLAIVCERYFVPSLEVICRHFNLRPDIAGATFMAFGTSSPELFASLIGAFVAKGDIGVGTVVGSAVFNLLCVTGTSGLVVGTTWMKLEWFPITRDCLFYVITVASLVFVIRDNVVTWIEASILLSMFGGYLIILYFDLPLKTNASKLVRRVKEYRTKWKKNSVDDSIYDESTSLLLSGSYESYTQCPSQDDSACPSSVTSSTSSTPSMLASYDKSCNSTKQKPIHNQNEKASKLSGIVVISKCKKQDISTEKTRLNGIIIAKCKKPDFSTDMKIIDSNEFEEEEEWSLLKAPQGFMQKVWWLIMWPGNLILMCTIPDCSTRKKLKWFPLTFMCSIMWLGALSYINFWMVSVIGYTFGIPDTVSGLTILAAGTSIPELISSVIIVKSGKPNMAFSNLVGSNIFDILFCLGLPWLVKAILNEETRSVVINSSALTYTTLILLSAVVLFYMSLLLFRWRLGWRVGLVAIGLYVSFLVLASLYESNVFGDYNPPTCSRSS